MDGAGEEPVCSRCKASNSLMWQKNKEGEVLCLQCYSEATSQEEQNASTSGPGPVRASTAAAGSSNASSSNGGAGSSATNGSAGSTGRRTRLRNAKGRLMKAAATEKQKTSASSPSVAQVAVGGGHVGNAAKKGGGVSGRRSLVKGKPAKATKPPATIVTSDTILHKVS